MELDDIGKVASMNEIRSHKVIYRYYLYEKVFIIRYEIGTEGRLPIAISTKIEIGHDRWTI